MSGLKHWLRAVSCATVGLVVVATKGTSQVTPAPPPPAAELPVPSDLRPLLAQHRSEIRLVAARYTADRILLSGNYAGNVAGGRGGGGRGGSNAPDTLALPPVTVSAMRIMRLKRFDLSWQAALEHLDAGKLSAEGRPDLDSLKTLVARNLVQLEVESATLADAIQVTTFIPSLLNLIEARLRLADVDAEHAASVVDSATRLIGLTRRNFDSGPNGPTRADRTRALRAASATETVRTNLVGWFNFYNGYDPLFTWWVPLPYKHLDAALRGYVAFLRDTVAPANQMSSSPAQPMNLRPLPAPKFNEVPDLAELLALPQDEMTDIVNRFLGRSTTGGRGGGRGGPAPTHEASYYQAWLKALETLDFGSLSRNAQVDYLYLKHVAELQVSRDGHPLPADPPRKVDSSGITGAARGREGLVRDLQDELIPYTPEQLIALAEREFAWCDKEMLKASREMGFGDNWKAALERTKTMHVPPGGQPAMIRDLIFQAIDYLRVKDLVTVPEIAAESQRMSMMSPQAQLTSPFFLGGSIIQVSYPTNEMEFDARMQSMRGNNRPWSHATAFHEMIPGHNLVGYIGQRFAGYRADLGAGGPFYGEGWPLYWETILYDKGFDGTPEERVGALFWRMHRCARIIFSLRFHMGQWSPQEAIDFLVERVGHERDNATAEVRRSFQGGYGPLYQAAYLLGGLQLRGLRREVVDSKQMPEKAFHDEVLRQGSLPIALIRLALTRQPLTREMPIEWNFYGDLPDR